jgi:uncharacterized membrane protein (UPF0127 family)
MICNLTKRTILARRPVAAIGPLARMRGMIGRDFRDFDAMVFCRCACIHTLGMRMPIDVVFVDADNRICALRPDLPPWHPFAGAARAVAVVEMPAGTIARTGAETGDILDLNAELTEAARKDMARKGLLATADVVMPCRNLEPPMGKP